MKYIHSGNCIHRDLKVGGVRVWGGRERRGRGCGRGVARMGGGERVWQGCGKDGGRGEGVAGGVARVGRGCGRGWGGKRE